MPLAYRLRVKSPYQKWLTAVLVVPITLGTLFIGLCLVILIVLALVQQRDSDISAAMRRLVFGAIFPASRCAVWNSTGPRRQPMTSATAPTLPTSAKPTET